MWLFLEKKLHNSSSAYIYQWILIYFHTNVGFYNISSMLDFMGDGRGHGQTVSAGELYRTIMVLLFLLPLASPSLRFLTGMHLYKVLRPYP